MPPETSKTETPQPEHPKPEHPKPEHPKPEQSQAQAAPTSVQPLEPPVGSKDQSDSKDATGGKPSPQRQALKLNVEGKQGQRHPGTPAGQHATGSFTDEASKETP